MTFSVMCPSVEEYTKANADPSYAPQETKMGTIETETEVQANQLLNKAIRQGKFPKGSCLVKDQ